MAVLKHAFKSYKTSHKNALKKRPAWLDATTILLPQCDPNDVMKNVTKFPVNQPLIAHSTASNKHPKVNAENHAKLPPPTAPKNAHQPNQKNVSLALIVVIHKAIFAKQDAANNNLTNISICKTIKMVCNK